MTNNNELEEAGRNDQEIEDLYRDREAERRGRTDQEIKVGIDSSEVAQGQCDMPSGTGERRDKEPGPAQRSGSGGGIEIIGRASEVDPDPDATGAAGADHERLASEDKQQE